MIRYPAFSQSRVTKRPFVQKRMIRKWVWLTTTLLTEEAELSLAVTQSLLGLHDSFK
jgi:hypothetical protein